MADSWGDICRQCVAVVADVPASVLLGTVLATALGVFVLVSRSRLLRQVRAVQTPSPRTQLRIMRY